LRYSFPEGARKREKIGDRELDTRRFRSSIYANVLVIIEHLFFHFDLSALLTLPCLRVFKQ
jgi:hypothetical protein